MLTKMEAGLKPQAEVIGLGKAAVPFGPGHEESVRARETDGVGVRVKVRRHLDGCKESRTAP